MAQVSYGTITITDTNDIESIIIEYARNQSTSSAPDSQTGGWSTTRPAWAQGYYIWQRARIHKSGTDASEDEFGTAVCITGSTGQTGASLTVSSIKYAVSTTESQPQDSSFTSTTVPTVAEGSWLWTKTEYSDGSKIYTKSKQGKSGDSVTVTKVEYQSGTSPTIAPTGSWSTSIPSVAEGNYLWTKTTYSDNNYSYTVAKQGQSGTSISITSTSVKYQVGTSATTAPTGTWLDNPQATTTEGQYLWTRTIVTYSDSSSTTSYSVSAHGATGTSVSVSSIKYAKSTTDSQPQDSNFGTSIPSVGEGEWLWTMTTYSNGSKMYTKSKQGKSGEDGRGLTATETKYTNVASGTTQAQVEALAESAWVNSVPSYNSSKPDYWVRIKNTYDKAPTTEYIYYKDNAVGDALAAAAMANSLAQSANENANGAMGQAASNVNEVKRIWFLKNSSGTPSKPTSSTTVYNDNAANHWTTIRPTVTGYRYYYYCEQTTTGGGVKSWSDVYLDSSELSEYEIGAMKTRFQNFFYPGDSNYPGAYAVGKSSSDGLDITDISTYGYNLRLTPTALSIGYNELKAIEIDGATPALNLYKPSKTSQGAQTARLDANGLVLSEGGLEAGTKNTTDYIYLYSKDEATNHTININSSGNKSDWRIIAGNKFGVDKAGNLYASNATISGAITATSLALGSGVTISTNDISGLSTVATSGSYNDLDNKPTIPSLTGYIHTDGTIGSTAAEGANSFTVASSGALTASNAIIYGTLYASKGYIGGWQIGTDGNKSLHNGSSNTSPTIGSGTIILSKGLTSTTSIAGSSGSQTWTIAAGTNFGVTTAGKLYATGAEISGTITVVSGSDLSAGLSDYSTTSETQSYVTGLGYQTSSDVNTIIGQTNVSALSDGSDYTKTTNLGNTTAVQNAAKTASNYLGDTDSNAGVTLKAQNGTTTANTSTSNYIKINTSGLEVFKAGISVALYGDTARIGKTNSSRFLLNANSLQAYNSSNTKYFEVSPDGMTYGSNTVASTTYADGKASAAQAAAETTAQGYANTAEANASYSVEIQVTSIDYTNNSATLVAIPYYQGSTTLPTGVTLSYQWYKNGSALTNTSTAPTITGATTNTLQLGEGTDFGSSTTNAIYTCVIS